MTLDEKTYLIDSKAEHLNSVLSKDNINSSVVSPSRGR